MRVLLFALLLLPLPLLAEEEVQPSDPVAWIDGNPVYGEAWPEGLQPADVGLALAAPDAYLEGQHAFQGRITQVCQRKGCWLVLASGEDFVRVFTQDHAFFLPKDTTGEAWVYGTLERRVLSEAFARHLAEDSEQDPEAVEGEQVELRIDAVSILIRAPAADA